MTVAAQLAALEAEEPELVASELRPILASLLARRRVCDACGRHYLQKRHHDRPRTYCQLCRNGGTRRIRLNGPDQTRTIAT
jgi:hypothetical protein